MPLELVKKYITPDVLSKSTIRLTCSSFDNVDEQIKKAEVVEYKDKEYKLHLGIIRLFVIIRRLGWIDPEIIYKTKSIILDNSDLILPYITPYLLINNSMDIYGTLIYTDKDSQEVQLSIDKINDNGTIQYNQNRPIQYFKSINSDIIKGLVGKMLNGISI